MTNSQWINYCNKDAIRTVWSKAVTTPDTMGM